MCNLCVDEEKTVVIKLSCLGAQNRHLSVPRVYLDKLQP